MTARERNRSAGCPPDEAEWIGPVYAQNVTENSRDLPSRFRRALLYVVQELGAVNVTKLQKILYLADLEHFIERGTTLTGAHWVRYVHGPMAKALVPSTALMDGHEVRVEIEPAGDYEAKVYRPGPAPRFNPALAPEERETLDRIITLTRRLTARDAVALAYNTAPMRFLLQQEADAGQVRLNMEIPFDLDAQVIADAATAAGTAAPGDVLAFKRGERLRIADLQEAALQRTAP